MEEDPALVFLNFVLNSFSLAEGMYAIKLRMSTHKIYDEQPFPLFLSTIFFQREFSRVDNA